MWNRLKSFWRAKFFTPPRMALCSVLAGERSSGTRVVNTLSAAMQWRIPVTVVRFLPLLPLPKKRPVPSIGVWQDLTQLDLFVHEAVQLFLAGNTNLDVLSVWIYGTLLRQYIAEPENACQHIPQVLAMALRHINYVMPQNLSIAELANKAGCSVMHLNRLFKQQFHLSPAEYILKQRMLFAANLLNSSLSVQRIASECGFKTTVGFYKAFNKVYNTTPGKYRMMQANKLQHKFNNVK